MRSTFLFVLAGVFAAHAQQVSRPGLDYSALLGPNLGATVVRGDGQGFAYVGGVAVRRGIADASLSLSCTVSLPGLEAQPLASFVVKLNRDGSAPVWTLCFEGTLRAFVIGDSGTMHVATSESVYRVILTEPPSASKIASFLPPIAGIMQLAPGRDGSLVIGGAALAGFPTTVGAYRPRMEDRCYGYVLEVCSEGFLASLDSAGKVLWATYTGTGRVSGVGVDSRGAVWAVGSTNVLGGTEGFVAKFAADGRTRTFAETFGGGSATVSGASDAASDLAVAADDSAYVTGRSSSGCSRVSGQNGQIRCSSFETWLAKYSAGGQVLWKQTQPFRDAVTTVLPVRVNARTGDAVVGAADRLLIFRGGDGALIGSRPTPRGQASIDAAPDGRIYGAGGDFTAPFVATPGAWITQYPGGFWTGYAARYDPSRSDNFVVTAAVNGASFEIGSAKFAHDGAIAPGEVVALFGEGFQAGPDLDVRLAGKRAPMLYADSKQINVVAPLSLAPGSLAVLSVRSGGQTIRPFELPVIEAFPALFKPVLNSDWSLNSAAVPAAPGTFVTLYMTGAGVFDTSLEDGASGPLAPPFPRVQAPVKASINRIPADVLYAGQAPGAIAGVVQLNVALPATLPAGPNAMTIQIGDSAVSALVHVR